MFGCSTNERITIQIPELLYPSDSTVNKGTKAIELQQMAFKDNILTEQLKHKFDSVFNLNDNPIYILSLKKVEPTQILLKFFNWNFWLYVDKNSQYILGTMLLKYNNILRKILIVGDSDKTLSEFLLKNFKVCNSFVIYEQDKIIVQQNTFITEPDVVYGFQQYIQLK